jgi:threonine aldolase
VLFCLSKGLGAPIGSMLVGEAAFIEEARRIRKLFGGGMRQAGIVAAAGLLALEDVERLAEDHANAARLAAGLAGHRGVTVPTPETNIVQLRTEGPTAGALVDAAADAGVLGGAMAPDVVRLCTHRDVSTADIDTAIERLGRVLGDRDVTSYD